MSILERFLCCVPRSIAKNLLIQYLLQFKCTESERSNIFFLVKFSQSCVVTLNCAQTSQFDFNGTI